MSGEKLGHAEESARVLDDIDPGIEASYSNAMAYAQVHATLAFTEQQRIANLIALAELAHGRWANYAGEAGGMGTLFSNPINESGSIRLRDDIRIALGLS